MTSTPTLPAAKACRRGPASIALPLLLAACATGSPGPQTAKVDGDVYGPARGTRVETVIVVLAEANTLDTPAHNRSFAAAAARAIPTSAAVALPPIDGLDPAADGYGTRVVAAAGESIVSLRARYPKARIVIVGDSGAAALAANLAGVQPQLVDGIVLVSCPCALPEWRAHMKGQGSNMISAATSAGLDPLKTAGGIAPTLRAAVVVGADDAVTPVKFSRAYAEALALRGVATDYRIVPGKGHGLLDDPEVLAATERLAAALQGKI
ncbi:alpha/beta hydrolase family protein [Sphingomonas sp. DT-207]|uniref:alpha/beta hydrolase family protein n=1 Tax=Sphingomonas sp. DT-207 TaxID=3396167 RepID=UPI003F1DEB6F